MARLTGCVAVVTGASRGVGRGVAIGLGEAGATVYVTGRSTSPADGRDRLGGTVFRTADAVTAAGGAGIPVVCDHSNDADTSRLFTRVRREHNRLDILVNNAWGGYRDMVEKGAFTWPYPLWRQPIWRWDAMFASGVRTSFTASRLGVPLMLPGKRGLIVNISFWAGQKYHGNALYGVAKAATDRLAADLAHELREHGIAAVSLYPGLVRTELVMANAQFFDFSNSESPQFIGRVIAALAADPHLMEKSGKTLVAAALALEYGVTDVDGKQPRPLTIDDV